MTDTAELLIMRHGEAETVAPSDARRRLTPAGESQVVAAAIALSDRGAIPDRLYVSPYVRASQTASIIARELNIDITDTWDVLEPECDPREVLSRIDSKGFEGRIMIVSHQPLVARIVRLHTGRDVSMATAKVVAVGASDWAPGGGTILWSFAH